MSIQPPKTIRPLESKNLASAHTVDRKMKPKYGRLVLMALVLSLGVAWFVGGWGNLSKADKEKLYQELVMREREGGLSGDSVVVLCQLAKELKKDIPEVCDKNAVYAKSSGKNGKHANRKRKDSACEKMEASKQKRDSLRKLPNKTPAMKKELYKTENEYKRNKQKCEDSGENHSQKPKG